MIEMIFSIVLFVMLLAGLIAFSLYLYVVNSLMTAAREGARYAATDSRLASVSTQSAAIADTRQRVQTVASSATGITLADADITVAGPTGTFGSRTVTVTISYDYTSSLAPMALMASYSGGSVAGQSLDASTIDVATVMRYEE